MTVKFTVEGKIKGKDRPRSTRFGRMYTPKETINYEDWVRWCYRDQVGNFSFGEAPIGIQINVFYKMPKASKPKTKEMVDGVVRPTKTPDWDNIGKIVCDALNNVAYHDDKAIIQAMVNKYWSIAEEYIEVVIWEVKGER